MPIAIRRAKASAPLCEIKNGELLNDGEQKVGEPHFAFPLNYSRAVDNCAPRAFWPFGRAALVLGELANPLLKVLSTFVPTSLLFFRFVWHVILNAPDPTRCAQKSDTSSPGCRCSSLI